MSESIGETESPAGRRTARINQVDVTRPPLILEDDGRIVKIYLHPNVAMRYYLTSQIDARCIVTKPGEATHILLDLLPPHESSSAAPTEEDRGYIYHRGDRQVLCGYWAQECLRVGGVAETGFWDLSGWDNRMASPESTPAIRTAPSKSPEQATQGAPATLRHFQKPGAATAAVAAKSKIAKARKSELAASSSQTDPKQDPKKRKRMSDASKASKSNEPPSSASAASEVIQPSRTTPVRPSVELKTRRKPRDSTQASTRPSPTPSHVSIGSSSSNASRHLSNTIIEVPTELLASKRRAAKGPRQFLPKLAERSSKEIQETWDYFMRENHQKLGIPLPDDAKMGNVDTVKQWMLTRVHEMWCETRSRYGQRNLDHLSIMLSTWKTARDFNLSPFAFRKYYDDFQGRINAGKVPHIPAKDRPPSWPFHERPPVNAEAGITWINHWDLKQMTASSVEVEYDIGGASKSPGGGEAVSESLQDTGGQPVAMTATT